MSMTGQILQLHGQLHRRTDGRIGHHMIGVPTLLLKTTGRRSGATRTNSLVDARDDDDYLSSPPTAAPIVLPHGSITSARTRPSRFRSPATSEGHRQDRRASGPRLRPPVECRKQENRDRYTAYQKQTARAIPVIVVTPT